MSPNTRSVYMEKKDWQAVKDYAKQEDRSISWVIKKALQEFMAKK